MFPNVPTAVSAKANKVLQSSSFFDIEWRQHSFRHETNLNNNTAFAVGSYRPLASLLMAGGVQIVEGLIVDFVHGAVGFRNHTAPVEVQTGAVWQEDLLFVKLAPFVPI